MMEAPFSQGDPWKNRDNKCKLLLGTFSLSTRGEFSQWEQSAFGIMSPRKWWIPQHWTHLRSSWTGSILSRVCFCQERSDEIIIEVSSNLAFYGFCDVARWCLHSWGPCQQTCCTTFADVHWRCPGRHVQRTNSPIHNSVQILGCYMTSVCLTLLERLIRWCDPQGCSWTLLLMRV